MSNRPSHVTRTIALRLPNDVLDVIERRAKKQGSKPMEYLRRFLTYDTRRKR